MKLRVVIALLPLACGGCAAMFHGTFETVEISTDPAGAVCNLWRDGEPIAALRATPGGVTIDKSKDVLTIVCDKPSYDRAYLQVEPQNDPLTGLDIILAPIALLFDEISGATHFYQPAVTVPMVKTGQAAPPRAAAPWIAPSSRADSLGATPLGPPRPAPAATSPIIEHQSTTQQHS